MKKLNRLFRFFHECKETPSYTQLINIPHYYILFKHDLHIAKLENVESSETELLIPHH
jgi:hypothetical protein